MSRKGLKRDLPRPRYGKVTGGLKEKRRLMDSQISMQSTVVAIPDQVSCRLDDETVLLELKNGTYYGLNSVGSTIWELIQQPKSIEAVYCAVLEQYDVDAESCRSDVLRLIGELQAAGLVEVKPSV